MCVMTAADLEVMCPWYSCGSSERVSVACEELARVAMWRVRCAGGVHSVDSAGGGGGGSGARGG